MNDAHLHLQDSRFSDLPQIILAMKSAGVQRCVVNGTGPDDWNRVTEIAERYTDIVIPSYGLHPWKTPQLCEDWKDELVEAVRNTPLHCIGECGLDRWMKDPDIEAQEKAFRFQINLANEHNSPLSIHVLKAWGWFLEILRNHPFPERGFLLHSYNGAVELVPELVRHGAYFSFSGYYLQPKKARQLEVFKSIPIDRLLIETDAPDMMPPEQVMTHSFGQHAEINHPANLPSISRYLAEALQIETRTLEEQLDDNFSRFFLRTSLNL